MLSGGQDLSIKDAKVNFVRYSSSSSYSAFTKAPFNVQENTTRDEKCFAKKSDDKSRVSCRAKMQVLPNMYWMKRTPVLFCESCRSLSTSAVVYSKAS